MHVLLVAYACEPDKGSEPGVGWNWAIHLSKYVRVTVLTRENNKAVIEKVIQNGDYTNLNFIYHDIKVLLPIKKITSIFLKLYYAIWVLSLKRFLKSNVNLREYNLIHFVTFNTFIVPPPINFPNIKSIWGPVGGGVLGHLESFKKISYRYYIEEFIRSASVKFLAENNIMQHTLSRYDKLVFANSDTAKLMNYKKQAYIELETGINKSNLTFSPILKEKSNNIVILSVGLLEARKGLHLLLSSILYVKADIKLIIIGKGILLNKLQKLVKKYNLNNVQFLGNMDYCTVQKYYQQSDIFVFPSLRDTSGNVVLEAMSKGLPIIAFDHQGMHDILDKQCAIKIPVESYELMVMNLAKAITDLSFDPKLRFEMGCASIKRIKENYLWENKAKRMVDIYREVLNENPSGS